MRTYLNLITMLSVYIIFILSLVLVPNIANFALLTIFIFFLSKPKYIFSPKCIVFCYYFLWFGLAPIFAQRYSSIDVHSDIFFYAYLYLSTSYVALFLVSEVTINENKLLKNNNSIKIYKKDIVFLLLLTVIFLFLYIHFSGGLLHWINNIDRAFLTRQGAGVYYLGFSLCMPLLFFLIASKDPKFPMIILMLGAILLLSPFIGSKQKIIFLFLLVFYRKLYFCTVNVSNIVMVVLPIVGLFVLGNFFRNSSWMTWSDVLSYSLNYFDTLDSLFIVLNDFSAFDKMTMFLPFNKFYNLFTGEDLFFDVSAYLSSIYFPHAWAIRATVQFPVEVDLYLSFGYFIGLPFLLLLYFLYCKIYTISTSAKTPILIYIWMNLFVYILSHLRGGVILWTDFYMYTFFVFIYFIFRKRMQYESQHA